MNLEERQATKSLLRARGVGGNVRVVKEDGDDEVLIVLPRFAAAQIDTRLEQDLQDLLHRKVWIVADGPEWEGKTEDL